MLVSFRTWSKRLTRPNSCISRRLDRRSLQNAQSIWINDRCLKWYSNKTANINVKNLSVLKLSVRAIFIAIKLQIIILPGLITEYRWMPVRVQNRIQVQMHMVETTRVTKLEYYFACTRKGRSHIFCHAFWQNDTCSFRAMNVALTLSFKLISF